MDIWRNDIQFKDLGIKGGAEGVYAGALPELGPGIAGRGGRMTGARGRLEAIIATESRLILSQRGRTGV